MAIKRNIPSINTLRVIKSIQNSALVSSWARSSRRDLVLVLRRRNGNPSWTGQCLRRRIHIPTAARAQSTYHESHLETTIEKPRRSSLSPSGALSVGQVTKSVSPVQVSDRPHPFEKEDAVEPLLQSSKLANSSADPKRHPEKIKRRQKEELSEEHAKYGIQPGENRLAGSNNDPSSKKIKVKPANTLSDLTALVPPYLAREERIPAHVPHRAVAFSYRESNFSDLDPRYGYLYSLILHVRDRYGSQAATRMAADVLSSYISTKLDEDWILARNLYMGLCLRFLANDLRTIRNSLIRPMLSEFPPRLEAVTLLIEPTERGSPIDARYIQAYVADFCRDILDPDLQLAEAEKILQGISESAPKHKTAVLLPLVRGALQANSPDRARDIITKLTGSHGLSVDFRVLNELVRPFAKDGDWSAADTLLEDLHQSGYSRSKPYAFAALVRTIYRHFAAIRNPSRMFDFLTYAMRNQGLVPTTLLSVTVIKDFVASRRYDLVRRYIHARQQWFPNILNPMQTSLAAYEIGDAWTHSGASMADVLSTCKALAYGSLRTPFADEFLTMTNSWLFAQLSKSTKMITKQIGVEEPFPRLQTYSNLDPIFDYIDRLNESAANKILDLRSTLLLETFRKQVEAARDISLLINNFPSYIHRYGMIPRLPEEQIHGKSPVKRTIYAPDAPEDILDLPGPALAQTVLDMHRTSLQNNETRDRRALIVSASRYLHHHQRYRDCTLLIRQVWASGTLMGAYTAHELIKLWIRSALELRDPKLLHEALWAVIDADPVQTTGYKLLILIRAAVDVILEGVDFGMLKQSPNQAEELKYLVSRCYRRRWQQEGYPVAEEILDPYLRKWRVAQDEIERVQREEGDVPKRVMYIY